MHSLGGYIKRHATIILFVIVNGACKIGDIAHIKRHIGSRCEVITMPERALLVTQTRIR